MRRLHRVSQCLLCLWVFGLAIGLSSCQPRPAQYAPLIIGRQNTPEQALLAELTAQLLKDKGFEVTIYGDFESLTLRKALLAGTVDIAWDYTGTVWSEYLGHDVPVVQAEELYLRLRAEDLPAGITWLPPAPCERRMGVVIRADLARAQGLKTLADLATYARSQDASLILCTTERLATFSGGLRSFAAVYGWDPSPARVRALAEPEILSALDQGTCQAALVPDAGSLANGRNLLALNDNRSLFHASNLAVAIRTNRLVAYPALEKHLADLSQALTKEVMASLRGEMARGSKPQRVARHFLRRAKLLRKPDETPTPMPKLTATPPAH